MPPKSNNQKKKEAEAAGKPPKKTKQQENAGQSSKDKKKEMQAKRAADKEKKAGGWWKRNLKNLNVQSRFVRIKFAQIWISGWNFNNSAWAFLCFITRHLATKYEKWDHIINGGQLPVGDFIHALPLWWIKIGVGPGLVVMVWVFNIYHDKAV